MVSPFSGNQEAHKDTLACATSADARLGETLMTAETLLSKWADECLHINHLATLIQREIDANNLPRARELSGRAQRRAWTMLNEMWEAGAPKPAAYTEPDTHSSG